MKTQRLIITIIFYLIGLACFIGSFFMKGERSFLVIMGWLLYCFAKLKDIEGKVDDIQESLKDKEKTKSNP